MRFRRSPSWIASNSTRTPMRSKLRFMNSATRRPVDVVLMIMLDARAALPSGSVRQPSAPRL